MIIEKIVFVKMETVSVHNPPKGHAFFKDTGAEDAFLFGGAKNPPSEAFRV